MKRRTAPAMSFVEQFMRAALEAIADLLRDAALTESPSSPWSLCAKQFRVALLTEAALMEGIAVLLKKAAHTAIAAFLMEAAVRAALFPEAVLMEAPSSSWSLCAE